MATKKTAAAAEPKSVVLKHPTFDDSFVLITDGTEDDWSEAGWRDSSEEEAAKAGVQLRPAHVSSEPVDQHGPGTGVDLITVSPDTTGTSLASTTS